MYRPQKLAQLDSFAFFNTFRWNLRTAIFPFNIFGNSSFYLAVEKEKRKENKVDRSPLLSPSVDDMKLDSLAGLEGIAPLEVLQQGTRAISTMLVGDRIGRTRELVFRRKDLQFLEQVFSFLNLNLNVTF